jgi:hypothetical protein
MINRLVYLYVQKTSNQNWGPLRHQALAQNGSYAAFDRYLNPDLVRSTIMAD